MIPRPDAETLRELYNTLSDQGVADKYGVGASTVRRWRRVAQIPSRPRGPRPNGETRCKISDAEIKHAVENAVSMSGVCRMLAISDSNPHMRTQIRKRIERLGYTTDHFTGKGHSALGPLGHLRHTTQEILDGAPYLSGSAKLKKRLIAEGLKQDICEGCGQGPSWNGKPLTLHLDHIDGDHGNNKLENLRVLCPNCHTQTPTYGSKKRAMKSGECRKCKTSVKSTSRWCTACAPASQERTKWPSAQTLRKMVWETPVSQISKHLGVTDVAIKKRCKRLGINTPPRGYWAKQYAEKKNNGLVDKQ